ncbi:MAG: DUF4142 domain-containing protein [Xanthobacteraceae bacterium]
MATRLIIGASIAAALLLGGPSFAQDRASQTFIKDAIEGNLAEVQMGQLAQKNGQSDGVRSFGQMLEKDHTEAGQKASSVATTLGVTPPSEPNSKQKADHDRMAKLNGEKFHAEFARHMIADHKKDISEYEKAAKKNDAAASYAQESLPVLRKHLETAQSLAGTPTQAKGKR